MDTNICGLTERVERYALSMIKPARYEHSVRTAVMAQQLCRLYGCNEDHAYLAGIAHDMCKEMNDELLLSLASKDGLPISLIEEKKPALLHGRAASVLLERDFLCTIDDVLEAVRNHTFGSPGMCRLAKILFAADKIEPGRPQVTEEYHRVLFEKPLDELVLCVLQENIDYLRKRGKSVSLLSLAFLESYSSSFPASVNHTAMEGSN